MAYYWTTRSLLLLFYLVKLISKYDIGRTRPVSLEPCASSGRRRSTSSAEIFIRWKQTRSARTTCQEWFAHTPRDDEFSSSTNHRFCKRLNIKTTASRHLRFSFIGWEKWNSGHQRLASLSQYLDLDSNSGHRSFSSRFGTITLCNGSQKTMEIFNRSVFLVLVFGRQIFISITGRNEPEKRSIGDRRLSF